MIEIIYNKWFWFAMIGLTLIFIQRFFFKDRATRILEKDYKDIITSDKYKVKGQYD